MVFPTCAEAPQLFFPFFFGNKTPIFLSNTVEVPVPPVSAGRLGRSSLSGF